MLKAGSRILSIWGGLNFLIASAILISVIFFNNAPILVMVFEKSEISRLDARVILAVNTLAILYNSCAAALSVLVMFVIWISLIKEQRWAFWALLITIGFVQILGFIASAAIGTQRLPVNIVLSTLYVVGIGLAGYSIFNRRPTDASHQAT
jgi:hypothetical protein